MTKFSPNPLNWFRKRKRSKTPPSSGQPALLKAPAKPRKSGNIFMHLINIQKSLRSLELSMRQKIDFSWLVQKITGQIAVLRLDAETIDEEELAAVAGQVEAYFETVAEGRLDFDEKGLAVMLECTNIYKNALGDTVSDEPSFHRKRLESWNELYQSLMANMKPTYEEPTEKDREETHEIEEEPGTVDEQVDETYEPPPVLELSDEDAEIEAAEHESTEDIPEEPAFEDIEEAVPGAADEVFEEEIPEELQAEAFDDYEPAQSTVEETQESISREWPPIFSETPADFASMSLEDEIESPDEAGDFGEEDEDEFAPEEEIPLYDPREDLAVRDVVISDAEIKSAREYMELGEDRPKFHEPAVVDDSPPQECKPIEKSPVQLQEVERLKSKLSELHEKQELLSTKMSTILGDYKKAVQTETGMQDVPSVEDLDIEDLEDIIFIGREKG